MRYQEKISALIVCFLAICDSAKLSKNSEKVPTFTDTLISSHGPTHQDGIDLSKRVFCNGYFGCNNRGKKSELLQRLMPDLPSRSIPKETSQNQEHDERHPQKSEKRVFCNGYFGCNNRGKRSDIFHQISPNQGQQHKLEASARMRRSADGVISARELCAIFGIGCDAQPPYAVMIKEREDIAPQKKAYCGPLGCGASYKLGKRDGFKPQKRTFCNAYFGCSNGGKRSPSSAGQVDKRFICGHNGCGKRSEIMNKVPPTPTVNELKAFRELVATMQTLINRALDNNREKRDIPVADEKVQSRTCPDYRGRKARSSNNVMSQPRFEPTIVRVSEIKSVISESATETTRLS